MNSTLTAAFTTNNMETELSKRLEEKKAQAIQEAEREHVALSLVDRLGLYSGHNVIFYDHSNTIHFGYRIPIDLMTARKILERLPAGTTNGCIKFVDRTVDTFSPFIICLRYVKGYSPDIKITYLSESGYTIALSINYSQYERGLYHGTNRGKHLGFGRYETESYYKFALSEFKTFDLAGGGQKMGCLDAELQKDFEYYIFNGKLKT